MKFSGRILLISLAAAALTAALSSSASGDAVHMKNGDRISGAVTVKEGMVYVRPEYSEKIMINFGKIEKIEIDQLRETEDVKLIKDPILQDALKVDIDPARYPNAGHMILYSGEEYSFEPDGSIRHEYRFIRKILKERSLDSGNVVRTYKKATEKFAIVHARSISPAGIVSNLRPDAVKYSDQYLSTPIYDKVKIVQFSVPEVRIGSYVDVKIVTKLEPNEILNPLAFRKYFVSTEPLLRTVTKISYPKSVNLEFKKFFMEGDTMEIVTEKSGDTTTVSFEKRDIPDYVSEPSMPPLAYFAPHVRVVERYPLRQIAAELKKRISAAAVADEKISSEVGGLIKGKKTGREKALAIYEFLATNIQPTGVPAEIDNFRPTAASVIFREKYASLYDRAVLLYTFLKEAGLQADIVMGRNENTAPPDRELYTIYDFPNILVKCGDDYLYPNAEYYPYGIFPAGYMDNEYFSVFEYSEKLAQLQRSKFERNYSDNALAMTVAPDGNTVFTLTETGYGEEDPSLRGMFKNEKPAKRVQFFEEIAADIASGGTLSRHRLSDVENHFERASYTIGFESPNYSTKLGDMYMLVPFPFVSVSAGAVSKESRKFDMFFDQYTLDSTTVTIRLPEGYRVKYLPKSIEEADDYLKISMKFSYDEKNNTVVFRRTNEGLKKYLPRADYKKFKALLEKTATLKKDRMILERVDKK